MCSSSEMFVAWFIGFILGALGVLFMAFPISRSIEREWQLEAVRHGAATMTVDLQTGETVFAWKTQAEKGE